MSLLIVSFRRMIQSEVQIRSSPSIQPVGYLCHPFPLCCLFRRTFNVSPCLWASYFRTYKDQHHLICCTAQRSIPLLLKVSNTSPTFFLVVPRFNEPNLSVLEGSHNLSQWPDLATCTREPETLLVSVASEHNPRLHLQAPHETVFLGVTIC